MSLTTSELQKIATLARLDLPPEKSAELASTLSGIIDFFEQLKSVNTDGVTPMAHPLNMMQRLRTDEVSETDQREKYQRQSGLVKDGLYLVPKVIE